MPICRAVGCSDTTQQSSSCFNQSSEHSPEPAALLTPELCEQLIPIPARRADCRKEFFPVRMGRCWQRVPREAAPGSLAGGTQENQTLNQQGQIQIHPHPQQQDQRLVCSIQQLSAENCKDFAEEAAWHTSCHFRKSQMLPHWGCAVTSANNLPWQMLQHRNQVEKECAFFPKSHFLKGAGQLTQWSSASQFKQ